jgi:hypothetical protein
MQLNLNDLPVHLVHVPGFGGKDPGILELDAMAQADTVFGYRNVLVVFFDPSFNGMASLPNANLSTSAGYAGHIWSFESQVVLYRPKEASNLLQWEACTLDDVSVQHPADATEGRVYKWKKGDQGGLLRGWSNSSVD